MKISRWFTTTFLAILVAGNLGVVALKYYGQIEFSWILITFLFATVISLFCLSYLLRIRQKARKSKKVPYRR